MKKLLILFISIIFLTACSSSNTPKGKVEAYLGRYTSMHEDVLMDLSSTIKGENLSEENSKVYEKVLTRQYENLKYMVKDESIDADKATVTVKITVFDLYKSEQTSLNHLNTNPEDFMTNDIVDNEKYTKYKLEEMLKTTETVDYELDFYLSKENGTWIVEAPDRVVLEKIHGLYDYES
ncbi:MAG: hypothetical protein IJB83_03845 [Bacilli bacterium]|nr:hypothetical protein [Bacilli bacterium]